MDNPFFVMIALLFTIIWGICGTIAFFDWKDCSARGKLQYETKYDGFTCWIKAEESWYSREEYNNRRNIYRLNLNEKGELSK